jgi:ParB-like chromosome segregation protein Spo0J
MVEPLRLTAVDTRDDDDDAMHPTDGLNPAPAGVEPSLRCRAPLKFDVVHIPVDDVLVIGTRRAINDDVVTRTAESIERIGLQTPITVRILQNVSNPETGEVLDSVHVLVAGLHRLEAYRKLGLQHIPAIIRDCSQLEAELWEIEENLTRSELTADEKTEHTLRLAALIKKMEETLEGPDFPKEDKPTTGRGHKGTVQKVAERIGVDQSTVRNRMKRATAALDEPVELVRDTSDELARKADKFKALAADHKAKRQAARKDREKIQATKPARQPDLVAAICDLNVAWPTAAIEAATTGLTASQKTDLRHHLRDVIKKLQWLGDSIKLEPAIGAVDGAT